MKYLKKNGYTLILLSFFVTLVAGCANMGTPSGGDYDFDPPKIMRTSPAEGAVNVTRGKVQIEFDENVVLVEQSEKVIITPPQRELPQIRSVNRKLTVELKDSLLANTTYTIDFTDAITDNNEGNILENYAFSFSTGDHVDTLAVSGIVLSADNLEPLKGMYVGLHSNLDDTAFTKLQFLRISRTNEYGKFTIKGIAPGKYRIYALADANRDYKYDNPSEAVAFLDAILEPSTIRDTRNDTTSLKVGEISIDSIKTIEYTRFLPDDIVLRSFQSNFKREYLAKHEKIGHKLNVYFGAPTSLLEINPINVELSKPDDWAILEKTLKNDTLTYWLNDPKMMAIDTLKFEVSYIETDSLNQPQRIMDTLTFFDRTRPKKEKKKKKRGEDETPEIIFMETKSELSSSWDVFKNIPLEFGEPLKDPSKLKESLKLGRLVDSTYTDIDFELNVDSLNPRKFVINHKWNFGAKYKLEIDSASVYSIYDLFNDTYKQEFTIKKVDEYGQLAIENIRGMDPDVPAFVELLDKNDKPIRKAIVKDQAVVFKYLSPGQYYARIVIDSNGNGRWDTGEYDKKLQPEMVAYFKGSFEIKANWDQLEDSWVVDTTNLGGQKPLEITKNKPKDKESKKKLLEQRDKKSQEKDVERRKQEEATKNNRGSTGSYAR